MPGIASGIYNTIFRQNTAFLTTLFAGAFLFEIGYNQAIHKFWDWNNQGRQWKDIKHRYVQNQNRDAEEDDEEE